MTEGMYFSVFFREGCVAMVPLTDDGMAYAGIGSSGLSTEEGLAYLVYREQVPMLVGHRLRNARPARTGGTDPPILVGPENGPGTGVAPPAPLPIAIMA